MDINSYTFYDSSSSEDSDILDELEIGDDLIDIVDDLIVDFEDQSLLTKKRFRL